MSNSSIFLHGQKAKCGLNRSHVNLLSDGSYATSELFVFPNEISHVTWDKCGNDPASVKKLYDYFFRKGPVSFVLSSYSSKRKTKVNNQRNPGSENTITMFIKKSNLCNGQNAFLSHSNHSRLKGCQEIGGTSS